MSKAKNEDVAMAMEEAAPAPAPTVIVSEKPALADIIEPSLERYFEIRKDGKAYAVSAPDGVWVEVQPERARVAWSQCDQSPDALKGAAAAVARDYPISGSK